MVGRWVLMAAAVVAGSPLAAMAPAQAGDLQIAAFLRFDTELGVQRQKPMGGRLQAGRTVSIGSERADRVGGRKNGP